MARDVVTCDVPYGGLLLLSNILPHRRSMQSFRDTSLDCICNVNISSFDQLSVLRNTCVVQLEDFIALKFICFFLQFTKPIQRHPMEH